MPKFSKQLPDPVLQLIDFGRDQVTVARYADDQWRQVFRGIVAGWHRRAMFGQTSRRYQTAREKASKAASSRPATLSF